MQRFYVKWRWLTILCLFVSGAYYQGHSWAADYAPMRFVQKTAEANLLAVHQTTSRKGVRNMVSGMAAADFDGDGWVDLFVLGGGATVDSLFINQQNGTFREEATLWGVDATHQGAGVATGDFNGDGWIDVYVTSHGPGDQPVPRQHRLYRNNGDRTFTDIAEKAGVNETNHSSADGYGAVFGDYDLDGDLDLFVTGWEGTLLTNRLFRNEGNETFKDMTEVAGLATDKLFGFSPCLVDMDGDRYPELLVAGDFDSSRYYVNNKDGSFHDQTTGSGMDKSAFGMGSTVNDFNNDGTLDWYLTSILDQQMKGEGNRLYFNHGAHVYLEQAQLVGVEKGYWGWGTTSVDLDHDGWLDIAETNGWTMESRFANQPNRLWRNNQDGSFSDISEASEFGLPMEGRGLIHFDYDHDGDQDLIVSTNNGPLHLFQNQLNPDSKVVHGKHWITVQLNTRYRPDLAPNGVGARIEILVNGKRQIRSANGCPTYLSQNDQSIHFGLGSAAQIDVLTVYWPDGTQSEYRNLSVDQPLTILAPSPFGQPGQIEVYLPAISSQSKH